MENAEALLALVLTMGAFVVLTLVCYWAVTLYDIWRRLR